MTYLTMNNFQIAADQAAAFEGRWHSRTSRLHEVPGFESFFLLRGEESEGAVHYATHMPSGRRRRRSRRGRNRTTLPRRTAATRCPKGWCWGRPVLQRFEVLLELGSE